MSCHAVVHRLIHTLDVWQLVTETNASCSRVRTYRYSLGSLWVPLSLPSSFRIVWCGLQCSAPIAFPAQLFHRPWSTQVAVMTEDARLVAFHSLDTVAPIVAQSPARPLRKARICKLDIWSFKICIKPFSWFKKMRNKNRSRQANYTVDMCFIEMIYRQDILPASVAREGHRCLKVK